MEPRARDFPRRSAAALLDPSLQQALARARTGFVDRRGAAIDALPDFEVLRAEAREIKEHTLAHLDHYLERYEEAVRAAGGTVHWAATVADARAIILDICRRAGARRVTKGKSMVA